MNFRLAGGAQPLILLPVQIAGRGPFQFIFDTGAGTSLVTPDVADQLGLKILGSKEGHSAGGKVAVSLATIPAVSVGEVEVQSLDVGIVDLDHVGKTIGAKIDGDLGYNFLKHFRITIDYPNAQICLEDPKQIEHFGRGAKTQAAIRLASPAKPLILVDVHANGRGPFQFAIDTGTSTTAIAPPVAKQLGISSSPFGVGTTAGAAVNVTAGNLKSFQLSGAKMENMPVVIADFFEMLSNAAGARLDGIVGYNFLRHHKVVIDYQAEMMFLF